MSAAEGCLGCEYTEVRPLDSMFTTPGFSIGYEPNPQVSAPPHSVSQRREKVTDDLIKVLPAFSYGLFDRKKFETSLTRMIRTVRGAYLVKNKLRANPAHSAHMIGQTVLTVDQWQACGEPSAYCQGTAVLIEGQATL